MVISIFKSLFTMIGTFLKWPLIVAGSVVAVFSLLVFVNFLYLRFVKKIPIKTGEHVRVKTRNLLVKLFYDVPRRFAKDLVNKDPEFFRHQGIIIFTGMQGAGKTISMIQAGRNMQTEYPKSVCLSNLKYDRADKKLNSWDDLIDFQNPNGSKCGVIVLNDELQTSYNSKQSKDFPMEYVGICTQNRKNRRVILGTAQSFYMLSKDIRTQCTELRECLTFFGCFTIVHRVRPVMDSSGEMVKKKHIGFYCFVHTDDLRNCYDTYEVIKGFKKSGFKPRSEQVNGFSDNQNNILVLDDKAKKKIKK